MIELSFVELFNPLFLGTKNHQQKLDIKRNPELKLWYIREEKEVIVQYLEHVAIVPWTAVNSMVPKDISFLGFKDKPKAKVIKNPEPSMQIKAQVSAPEGIKI